MIWTPRSNVSLDSPAEERVGDVVQPRLADDVWRDFDRGTHGEDEGATCFTPG